MILATSLADLATSPFYKKYPIVSLTQRPLKVVNKIIDETAFKYTLPSQLEDSGSLTVNIAGTNGWGTIIVAVTGVPVGTTPVSIETITQFETIPAIGASTSTSPAATNSSSQLEMGTNISARTPAAYYEGMNNAVGNFVQATTDYAGNLLGYGMAGARSVVEPVFGELYAGAQGYAYGLGRGVAANGLAAGLGYLGYRANRRIMY